MPIYLSLKLHHVGHTSPICASAICRTCFTFLTKLVPIVCVLTATCSPSRLLVAAPFLTGRLLSSSAVLNSACSSIAFFTNSGARSRKECASHIECMSSTSLVDVRGRRASLPADGRRASGRRASTRQQMVDVRLGLSAISLTTCRLNYICKEVLHYFPDLFYIVCTYSL